MRKYAFLLLLASTLFAGCTEENEKPNPQVESGFTITYPDVAYTTEAGGAYELSISLKSTPLADVVFTITTSDSNEGLPEQSTVIINSQDYNTPHLIRIIGQDDDIQDGNKTYLVTVTAASADPAYNHGTLLSVSLVNYDNDTAPDPAPAGFIINRPEPAFTTEAGGSYEISFALETAPAGDVTLTVETSDASEGQPQPSALTFTAANYNVPQTVRIVGQDDHDVDGDVAYQIDVKATSTDPAYHRGLLLSLQLINYDNDKPTQPDPEKPQGTKIRLMTANASSGSKESYDTSASQNILKATQADIVMIQEFKVFNQSFREFVDTVYGPEFYYYRGTVTPEFSGTDTDSGAKPNGIISRYEIIQTGEWKPQYQKTQNGNPYYVDAYKDRQWTWAVIDIPGDRDLLAVSVHLHTDKHATEYNPLMEKIAEKQKEGNYYVVIGGDFNTKEGVDGRETVLESKPINNIFHVKSGEWPEDQKGNANTNAKRGSPLDWLLMSKDLQTLEIPVEIGAHTGSDAYPHGHVFDTRVYAETYMGSQSELSYIPPCEPKDSGYTNMQHMPVIRDILIPNK